MIIYHISDSHSQHKFINLDLEGVDVLIHSGDESNYKSPALNEEEFYSFVHWYKEVPIEHKIFIAGNHSGYVATHEREARKILKDNGIIYLNKEEVTIDGVKFYGDPTTPSFGDWYFMAGRSKIHKHWDQIPKDVEVLITHGPPKGIMDLTKNRDGSLSVCGCSNLRSRIEKEEFPKLKAMCYGHIHQVEGYNPPGVFHYKGIQFSNAASVEDGRFDKGIVHHGNKIII